MRALTLHRPGLPGGLVVRETPTPAPGPGQIAIDVEVSGLGMIDALWASGAMPADPGFVPGLEVSGTVRALGDGVDAPLPGTRVAAILPSAGGLAEVVCAPAALVAPIPAGLTAELAAVVPVNTVTMHLALTTVARGVEGADVLVHAGVGGLGSSAGQLARLLGARSVRAVVGTPAKADRARELGYDDVVLRDELDRVPDASVDVVVDPVGGPATASAPRMLRSGGRLLRLGNASQAPDVPISSLDHWLRNVSTVGFNVGAWLADHPAAGTSSLAWALESVASGRLRVDLAEVGGTADVDRLLGDLVAGRAVGKLAVDLRRR